MKNMLKRGVGARDPLKDDRGEDAPFQIRTRLPHATSHYKQYTLAAILTVEKAFNNVSLNAIKVDLSRVGSKGCLPH